MGSEAGGLLVGFLNAREGPVGQSGTLFVLCYGKPFAFAIEDQLGVVDERHAVLSGKILGVAADEVDVGTLLKDETRRVDGIAQAFNAGHATGAHGPGDSAIHEQCIELDFAIAREKGAAARVKSLVIFENGDSGLYRIDRSGAAFEQRVAGKKSTANAEGVGFDGVIGDGPGAAMNEKDGLIGHANRSSYMHGVPLMGRRCTKERDARRMTML